MLNSEGHIQEDVRVWAGLVEKRSPMGEAEGREHEMKMTKILTYHCWVFGRDGWVHRCLLYLNSYFRFFLKKKIAFPSH